MAERKTVPAFVPTSGSEKRMHILKGNAKLIKLPLNSTDCFVH